MIAPERFIARYSDFDLWMAARARGVTATEVRDAATPSGLVEVLERRRHPEPVIPNAYMEFGSAHEGWISMYLKAEFDLMPNEWAIAAADEPRFLATPDGLSLDHRRISEIKTGGKEPKSVPLPHRRQANWQLRCTDAEECVYAFMLRDEVNGVLVPAWMEPKTWVIERDDVLIAELEVTARRLLED